jgi:hypothetical protein
MDEMKTEHAKLVTEVEALKKQIADAILHATALRDIVKEDDIHFTKFGKIFDLVTRVENLGDVDEGEESSDEAACDSD